ncbi:MAG: HAD family phosphatase [Clostridia bacterium]|nr:HAD family phosphatase [Clostridia bacterium]
MVKNIIFDIGGVILYFNRDFLLSKYYSGRETELLKEKLFKDWELLDEDAISIEEYNKNVLSSLPERLHAPAKTVLNYWEYAMSYKKGIVDLVRFLKEKGYNLYILSNMTYHFIERDYKFPLLKEFDGIVYSAEIKLIKPNPEIFKYILNKFDLVGEECLFIDDLKPNLESAQRFGIKTYQFLDDTEDLKNYILTL